MSECVRESVPFRENGTERRETTDDTREGNSTDWLAGWLAGSLSAPNFPRPPTARLRLLPCPTVYVIEGRGGGEGAGDEKETPNPQLCQGRDSKGQCPRLFAHSLWHKDKRASNRSNLRIRKLTCNGRNIVDRPIDIQDDKNVDVDNCCRPTRERNDAI